MLKSKTGSFEPWCQLSHDLINQLSIIVGNCDLLSKEALEGSEYARRLFLIREVAKDMGHSNSICTSATLMPGSDLPRSTMGRSQKPVDRPRAINGNKMIVALIIYSFLRTPPR